MSIVPNLSHPQYASPPAGRETLRVFDWSWDRGEWTNAVEFTREGDFNGLRVHGLHCNGLRVHALHWDILVENNQDIREFVWNGRVRWRMGVQHTDHIPLSTGDWLQQDAAQDKSVYEQLAAIADTPSPDSTRLGDYAFYRGCFRYHKQPIIIPAWTQAAVLVEVTPNFQLRGELRFRLSWHAEEVPGVAIR